MTTYLCISHSRKILPNHDKECIEFQARFPTQKQGRKVLYMYVVVFKERGKVLYVVVFLKEPRSQCAPICRAFNGLCL